MENKQRYRAIAEYYDAENAHHRVLEEDVPFFLGQLPRKKQDILELAVGTARAAIPLAQAGHRVVGVDYAADMLEIARRKRDGVGLGDKQLALIEADVLSLDLRRKFDWVCVFFNTFLAFTTLEQQDAVLQRAWRISSRGADSGSIFFSRTCGCFPSRGGIDLDPSVFFVPRFDRTVLKTTEIRRASTPQLQHVTFHYTWFGPHGQPHHERTRFDMTYIFPRELRLLLERNGLEIEHLWGNYDGSKFMPESPRMIVRCCRA